MDQENPETLATADDSIAAEWAKISEKYAVEPEVPEVKAEPEVKTEPKAAEPRARDEAGKFAKAEPKAEVTLPAVTEPAPAAEPTAEALAAPSSWKPAAKAAWAAIPPEVQAEIHRREGDWLKGQGSLLPDAQFGKAIREKAAPYQQLIASEGATVDAAFGDYLKQAAMLRTGTPEQKAQLIASGIRQFGVPVELLNQALAQPQQAPQQFRDPRLDQFFAQQEQRQNAEVIKVIEDFSNAKDAKGQPLRPFVGNVEGEMQALIPAIRAAKPQASHGEVLQEAYDRAVWANPETRPLLEKQRLDELEAKRREDNLRQVAEAKKAASVNVPKRGFTTTSPAKKSMDDTITETARELGILN